jgi:hypothetical protein
MDRWAWEQLTPWLELRATLPVGAVLRAAWPDTRAPVGVCRRPSFARPRAARAASVRTASTAPWGAPRTLGRSLRILGLIKGGSEGTERIREAVSLLKDSPAHLEHRYALTDLGASLSPRQPARRGPRRLAGGP